ncbi:MAG: MarC family protein [Chitinispirillaceae bacterium]|nr:MarC family protein [Chitinispirillaceae bacterium]
MNLHTFWLCFVPLFIAADSIGALPVFISITQGVKKREFPKLIVISGITACIVGLLFVFVGEWILRLMGISVADFMVAGGSMLFVISLGDLVTFEKATRRVHAEEIGPVPIGVPLIVGPGVLTTVMLLVKEYGFVPTTAALIANIVVAGVIFASHSFIIRIMGKNGTKIISKIASLFLAAIAVMIVRKGLFIILQRS